MLLRIANATESISSLIIDAVVLKRTTLEVVTCPKLLAVSSGVLLSNLLDLLIVLGAQCVQQTVSSSATIVTVLIVELVGGVVVGM